MEKDGETTHFGRMAILRWLEHHAIFVLVFIFCVGLTLVLWQQKRLQDRMVDSNVTAEAQHLASALETFRSMYTSEVVETAKAHGLEVTHDYDSGVGERDAIPLPATLSMKLGNELGKRLNGGRTQLYSPFPFPYPDRTGLADSFAENAWSALNENPDVPYLEFSEVDGHPMLRYGLADRMRQSCVDCHNTHADSPKRDWKSGDVRGVLEVSLPLDDATAQVSSDLRESFFFMAGVGGLALFGLVVVFGRLRRVSEHLEHQVSERTAELVASQQKLVEAHEQISAIVESAVDSIIVIEEHGIIASANHATEKTFGYQVDEIIGKNVRMLMPDPYQREHDGYLANYLKTGEAKVIGIGREVKGQRKDGTTFPMDLSVGEMKVGGKTHFVGIANDITERKQAEDALKKRESEYRELAARLDKISNSDALTGIANRRAFDKKLDVEWKRVQRNHRTIGLILLDIDFFKPFNDHYGHQAGDECLQKVARVLDKQVSRAGELLARYGGEEFAVILPDTNSEEVSVFAEKLRRAVTEANISHEFSDAADHVTVSLGGVVMSPDQGVSYEELIKKADQALYQAKGSGRNRFNLYVD